MAKQTIGIGAVANDGTGDPLRTAYGKANDNFDELYAGHRGWLNVKSYGATGDGVRLADGVATNSDATFTSASATFTAGDIGKVFEITSGSNHHVTTIVSINSTTSVELTAAPNFSASDCVVMYGTDDTDAIQDALDACEPAGGGTVYFPRGVYVVNGALQDTSRSNAQLLLPRRDYVDTEAITIILRGEAPPSSVFSVIGATPIPNNLSVIKGTLNTASGTAPSLIGAHGPVGTSGDFSNVFVGTYDLAIEMPDNPQLTAVDCSRVAQFDANHLLIHTGGFDLPNVTTPTTSASFGLRTPGNNNGAMTRLGTVTVVGFYKGYEVGEHCNGRNVTAGACLQGYVFVAANHSSMFTRLQTVHCARGIVFTGEHTVHIAEFNIEHAASGDWVTTYDVDDASNFARGALYWHVVLAGTGADNTFTVNGAKHIKRAHLYCEGLAYQLTDGATVTPDCNISSSFRWTIGGNRTLANPTAPWDGQVINIRITQNGSGNNTWSLGSKYKFAGGSPALSTAASAADFVSCQYDANADTWHCALMKAMS